MHTIILTHFSLPGISTGSKYRYMFIVTSLYCQFLVGVFNFEFLTVGSSHFLSVYQTPQKGKLGAQKWICLFSLFALHRITRQCWLLFTNPCNILRLSCHCYFSWKTGNCIYSCTGIFRYQKRAPPHTAINKYLQSSVHKCGCVSPHL